MVIKIMNIMSVRILRSLILSLLLASGGMVIPPVIAPEGSPTTRVQAGSGMILYTHRYINGQWWTDMWNVEFPGMWMWLGSMPGYW
jgi:hypothetical protein